MLWLWFQGAGAWSCALCVGLYPTSAFCGLCALVFLLQVLIILTLRAAFPASVLLRHPYLTHIKAFNITTFAAVNTHRDISLNSTHYFSSLSILFCFLDGSISINFTFMLLCIVIDFFLNNQPDTLLIPILFCYKAEFHPNSTWKRPSENCMKLSSAECTVENS